MSQFYLPGPWSDQPQLAPTTLTHHLRVRRIRSDESIQVFNGAGQIAKAQISDLSSDKSIFLNLSEIHDDLSKEPRYPIVLIQGIAGGDKMDWIIEKAVELGVTHIIPTQTARSIVKLDAKRAQKRLEHWQAIIIAACEQSERNVLPTISSIQSFEESLLLAPPHQDLLKMMLSPRGSMSLISIAKRSPGQGISLLIGPEGGLSESEEDQASQKGFLGVTLGERILRTETAGIVAMAAVHTLWGGF
jgi:16S rRNA (uracil1498-N3)-methyltransferase